MLVIKIILLFSDFGSFLSINVDVVSVVQITINIAQGCHTQFPQGPQKID